MQPLIGYLLHVKWGFPGSSDSNESACNTGDLRFDLWVRKIPWMYMYNPMYRGSWHAIIHGGPEELDLTNTFTFELSTLLSVIYIVPFNI